MAKVLMIDDDDANLDIMSINLKKAGYDVETEKSSENALNREYSEFDLVLLDIMMPRVSGYEVLKPIRARYSMSELPVLMLSALDNPLDTVATMRIGANDYVSKPVNMSVLSFRIQVLLMKKLSQKGA